MPKRTPSTKRAPMRSRKSTNLLSPGLVAMPGASGDYSLKISGTLHDATIGYPLQGLTVQVYFLEPHTPADTTPQAETLLGSGLSSQGGLYQIAWLVSPVVTQRICLLANCPDSLFVVKVFQAQGGVPLEASQPTPASGNSVVVNLSIPLPQQKLAASNWKDMGDRLKNTGLTRLSDLVKQLAFLPTSQSLFGDWATAMRMSAVAQLETAFLDPQGTLGKIAPVPSWQQLKVPNGLESYKKSLGNSATQSGVQHAFTELSQKVMRFAGISTVDWIIAPGQFTKSPASAITANQSNYFGTSPRTNPNRIDFFPELGYRDYLRTQWTSMITLVVYIQGQRATQAQAEQQLRNRFHQDFNTQDNLEHVANEILIPILTEILKAPTGSTFGFGIPAAQIPARGGATARQYLDILIGLSKLSPQELTLRYRTNFARPDTVMSSAIWENIFTLQAFFRDSFQSVVDPAHPNPDVFAQPIIPDKMQGRAPFFLEYGEWLLLLDAIPFENYFQIRQVFELGLSSDFRQELQNLANTPGQDQTRYQFYASLLPINDNLVKAYQHLDQSEYQAALTVLGQLPSAINSLLSSPVVSQVNVPGGFSSRAAMTVASLDDLQKLIATWHVESQDYTGQGAGFFQTWAQNNLNSAVCSLVYLGLLTIPVVSAQASLALGDYPTAVLELGRSAFFLTGKATMSATTAYRNFNDDWSGFRLYHAGNLPYTVDTEAKLPGYPSLADDDSVFWDVRQGQTAIDNFANSLLPAGIHPVEMLFFRLQMGGAMLEWADTLYRTDDASNISRARELYKGVYYLHGTIPPINPNWGAQQPPGTFFNGSLNPAQASQLARAELGFTQINAGLNFFGYADDMVPILRYSTLKAAADGFASEAKSAEQDFLNFMGQLESATIENMKNAAMLKRADLQAKIADQQVGIAQDQIAQAQILIAQVNQQIAAAQQQIADHDSFFGQFSDYVDGMGKTIKGMVDFGKGAASAADFVGVKGDMNAFLAVNQAAVPLEGIAAFGVVSYITLSSMADAQNQRQQQLTNLQRQNLPAAQLQSDIANRSLTIASLNKQIAAVDAQLATDLLAFAQERYLSIEFWSYMASTLRRILRQFLDLATRMGWLAQRALSYEQNNDIRVILMDYFPAKRQGAGGADLLQLDLAVLEARHLDGLREMIPVKYTISLARDFPLQFAQLRTTGQCVFQTMERPLQRAYPGTFAYRIIAVSPKLTQVAPSSPIRGLLSNSGISQISASDGSQNVSVRPVDALPVSEFNLGITDMQVWGLPGGTLMQFEGSGVETMWKLEFPPAANPSGLNGVADVLITMNLRAQFGLAAYQAQLLQLPHVVTKFVLVSGLKQQLSGLADLQGNPAKATIVFDLTAIGLPGQEQNRKVNNIVLLMVGGENAAIVKASVNATAPAQTIAATISNGAVFSNAPPVTDAQSTVQLSPLNVLAGATVDQTFSLLIDKNQNPGVDFSTVRDVLLGVDYTAAV
jgi:hypothetical protein